MIDNSSASRLAFPRVKADPLTITIASRAALSVKGSGRFESVHACSCLGKMIIEEIKMEMNENHVDHSITGLASNRRWRIQCEGLVSIDGKKWSKVKMIQSDSRRWTWPELFGIFLLQTKSDLHESAIELVSCQTHCALLHLTVQFQHPVTGHFTTISCPQQQSEMQSVEWN